MADPEKRSGHVPVLLDEMLERLAPASARLIVDATVGGGGHAEALLDAAGPHARLLGLDWDAQALDVARRRLARFGDRVRLARENFTDLAAALEAAGEEAQAADVILFDFGLSAFHVETPERGFSLRLEGPLDMRMDTRQTTTAADLVNRLDAKSLAEVLHRYGGERKARAIAREICKAREYEPIRTTTRLAQIVVRTVRQRGRWRIHPATRTFQALRIQVNDELANAERAIPAAAKCLAPDGRMAAISFHSLEDRIVKVNFKRLAATGPFEIVTRKPVGPTLAERRRNARARSAKLRVLRKRP